MSTDATKPQKQVHPNQARTMFKPGVSGNPGGKHKNTPKITNAYARLLQLSPAELEEFTPSNVAEQIALEQVKTAQRDATRGMYNVDLKPADTLAATKEITDRTEGRALQRVQVDNTTELERLVIRVQERVLAQSGIQMDHEQALQIVTSYRPELAEANE